MFMKQSTLVITYFTPNYQKICTDDHKFLSDVLLLPWNWSYKLMYYNVLSIVGTNQLKTEHILYDCISCRDYSAIKPGQVICNVS